MGKLSSFLDDLGTSYLQSEMGLDNDSVKERLKNQKFCPSCGNEVEKNSTVCYGCGVNPQKVKNKKFCPFCGKQVNTEQVICLNCKESIENTVMDEASGGMKVICFLIPIIGLIIYIANANTRKEYASSCGTSALYGFVTVLLLGLILAFILFV